MIASDDPRLQIARKVAERLRRIELRNRARAHRLNKTRRRDDRIEIEAVDFVQTVIDWNGCCCLCCKEIDLTLPGTDNDGLTLEHMVSLAQGGSHTARNIGPAHRRCNMKKANEKDGPGAAKIKRRQGIKGPRARKARREAGGKVRLKPAHYISRLSKHHPNYVGRGFGKKEER